MLLVGSCRKTCLPTWSPRKKKYTWSRPRKPETDKMLEKIAEGKLKKFYSEVV